MCYVAAEMTVIVKKLFCCHSYCLIIEHRKSLETLMFQGFQLW